MEVFIVILNVYVPNLKQGDAILYQTRILYQYLPTVAEGEDSKVCFIKGNINHHLGSTIQSATIEQLLLNIFEKLRNLKVIMVMEEMI